MTRADRGSPDGGAVPPRDRPVLAMTGEDGNAFAILGRARRALLAAGREGDWDAFAAEATSGDYDRLLATVMDWFDVR